MRYHISPTRHLFESVLNLVGHGPRQSRFTPARDPESRLRFAQYFLKLQPPFEAETQRRNIQLIGSSGALSSGIVRHASVNGGVSARRLPAFQFMNDMGSMAARRRAAARQKGTPIQTLLHALRVR
jgi:hypothetical protein